MATSQEIDALVASYNDVPVKYLGQMVVPKQELEVNSDGNECEQAIRFLSQKGSRKDYRHGVAKDVNLTIAKTADGGELLAKAKNGKEHIRVALPQILGIGVVGTKFAFHINGDDGQSIVHAFQIKRRGTDEHFLSALTEGSLVQSPTAGHPQVAAPSRSAAGSASSSPTPQHRRTLSISSAAQIQQLEQQISDARSAASTAETARLSAVLRWVSAEREVAEMKAQMAEMRTQMATLTADVVTDMAKFKSETQTEARKAVLLELSTVKQALEVIFDHLPARTEGLTQEASSTGLWEVIAQLPRRHRPGTEKPQTLSAHSMFVGDLAQSLPGGVSPTRKVAEMIPETASLQHASRDNLLAMLRLQEAQLKESETMVAQFAQVQADLMDATMQNHNMAEEIAQLQSLYQTMLRQREQEQQVLADTIAGQALAQTAHGDFGETKNKRTESIANDNGEDIVMTDAFDLSTLEKDEGSDALALAPAPRQRRRTKELLEQVDTSASLTIQPVKPGGPELDDETVTTMDEEETTAPTGLETYHDIAFQKTAKGLGLSIAGGADDAVEPGDPSIYITNIIDGSAADLDGNLKIGDRLITVNGVSLENVTHDQAVQALQHAANWIQLHIGRLVSPDEDIIEIVLAKRAAGLGFSIAGGSDFPTQEGDSSIYITMLIEHGAGAADGRLRVGDKLVEVNGQSMQNITHDAAVRILQTSPQQVRIVVARLPEGYPATSDDNHSHANPVLGTNTNFAPHNAPADDTTMPSVVEDMMEIEFARGSTGLGFSIAGGTDHPVEEGDVSIYVTQIIPGSAAEQDGRLRVGDRLVVVNGVELLNVKHDEAVHSLRINGSHVKMVVSRLPVLQKQVLEIAFAKGVGGLGFSISGGTDDMEGDDASIYVTDILPQGSAFRDGQLCVGDRIVEVNGYSLLTVTHDEAVQYLQSDSSGVHLVVERLFDTTSLETCLDISFKKGLVGGLGFSIAGGIDDCVEENDPGVYCTNIIEGSAAHLDGRLKFGDKLLEVNGVCMLNVTHGEAVAALTADPNGVSMRVARLPETDASEEIFQFDFPKGSMGLGFSVAGGTDDAVAEGDVGIYVTNISPGLAADIDGRLKVEDRLLVANGQSLANVTHAQAVKILQLNPTGVKLTVSRWLGNNVIQDESCA